MRSGLTTTSLVEGPTEVCVEEEADCPLWGDAITTALVPSASAPVNEICPDELILGRKAATKVLWPPISVPACATVVTVPLLYKYTPKSPVDVIP